MGLPMSTNKLRSIITTQLLQFCPNVAYKRAKQTDGPRIVFILDRITADEVMRPITLDIRISCRGDDSSALEDLTDAVWDFYDHLYYRDDSLEFAAYQNTRSDMDEEDSAVLCRRLLIEIRAL